MLNIFRSQSGAIYNSYYVGIKRAQKYCKEIDAGFLCFGKVVDINPDLDFENQNEEPYLDFENQSEEQNPKDNFGFWIEILKKKKMLN